MFVGTLGRDLTAVESRDFLRLVAYRHFEEIAGT